MQPEMDDLDGLDEADIFDDLSAGIQRLAALQEQQLQVLMMLVQEFRASTGPRRLVRDQSGRAIGSEVVRADRG